MPIAGEPAAADGPRGWARTLGRALGGGEGVSVAAMLAGGALVWGAYAALQIAVNGVLLDDNVVTAQIITGSVSYPAGHPHERYYVEALSLSHYAAAGLWWLGADAKLVSAVRNLLFLWLSTFVPFAFATLLTRRPLWGHVAASLMTLEAIIQLQGLYPIFTYPFYYANGHFGMNTALLAAALLLVGSWKTGGLLVGLMPSLHATNALLVGPWSGLYLLGAWGRHRGQRRALILAGAFGFAVSVAMLVWVQYRAAVAPIVPPYDVEGDARLIYENFKIFTDGHRRPLPLRWLAYSLAPLAYAALAALLLWRPRPRGDAPDRREILRRDDVAWVLLLGAIGWAFVYGVWLLQKLTGGLPFVLEIVMPWRFSNPPVMLLLPLTASVLGAACARLEATPRRVATWLVAGLLLAGAALLALKGQHWLSRHPIFVAWGVVLGVDAVAFRDAPQRALLPGLVVAALGGLLLALGKTASCVLLGAGFGSALLAVGAAVRRPAGAPSRWDGLPGRATAAACALASLVALPQIHLWDSGDLGRFMHEEIDRQLAGWLRENAGPDELILPFLWPRREIQAKMGQPVLLEEETFFLVTYMPRIAPVVAAMARDFYGVDYADREQLRRLSENGELSLTAPVWRESWTRRSTRDWQALALKYGFRLVLAPDDIPLDLPAALPGEGWTLYTIPEPAAPGAARESSQ